MKKILYVITSIKKTGPNRVLDNMINSLNKKKYEVYVISLFASDNLNNCTHICLNLKNKFDLLINGFAKFNKIVDSISPDIVHSHGFIPDYFCSKIKKYYTVSTLHCNIYSDYLYAYGRFKSFFMIKMHVSFLKRIDNVICCSYSVYNDMEKSKLNNLAYIRNGIKHEFSSVDKKDIRDSLKIKSDDIVYIYSGSIIKRKNVLSLINMMNMNMLHNEHLIIIGDGPEFNKIKNDNKNLNIHLLGFRDNVYDYLKCADVYVSFSFMEGLSISVIEALDSGLLLLLSDIDSHKEFFNIDKNTYIGEVFNDTNFNLKMNCVRKKIKMVNKSNLISFKEKYLSDISMMEEYCNVYECKN